MTAVLGISAFYHDSAAALVVDGELVAAAQEERFTRKKHDPSFPRHAIDYCLSQADLDPGSLDFVGFYEKPLLKFERLLETYLSYAPVGLRSFLTAMPQWLERKLHLRREIRNGLQHRYDKRILFCEHHQAHAASAFYPSPFEEAAILTLDAVGEWTTTSFGVGQGNQIKLLQELRFPHSLGLLYSAFTYFSGFRVNDGEYKLMGLAPYGQPKFTRLILDHLIDVKPDGSFRLDMRFFNYCQGLTMTSNAFHRLFGAEPRKCDSPIRQIDMDLAASIQQVTEEIILKIACHVHARTGQKYLCLAGGVALNCVANGRLVRESPFDSIWIQPAAGDAGGALGVAELIWYQLLDRPRHASPRDSQSGSLLGPTVAIPETRIELERAGAVFEHVPDMNQLVDRVAELLADENVVGWVQGRMEYGPRALGNRSILGDPRNPVMQSLINLKVKLRESFRPFAPSVLRERAADIFIVDSQLESPYMLLTASVKDVIPGKQRDRKDLKKQQEPARTKQNTYSLSDKFSASLRQGKYPCQENATPPNDHPHFRMDSQCIGLERINEVRGWLPAITHIDGSARIQTVDSHRFPVYYRLLEAFERRTGCPVLINTSFNVRDEPIVCSAVDAYRCFMATNIDVLVVDHFLMFKSKQLKT